MKNNAMKNTIKFGLVTLLVLALLYVNPVDIYHAFTSEKRIMKTLSDPTVRAAAFNDDAEISDIEYVGSRIYHVITEENEFYIHIKKDGSTTTLDIFEKKQHIRKTSRLPVADTFLF